MTTIRPSRPFTTFIPRPAPFKILHTMPDLESGYGLTVASLIHENFLQFYTIALYLVKTEHSDASLRGLLISEHRSINDTIGTLLANSPLPSAIKGNPLSMKAVIEVILGIVRDYMAVVPHLCLTNAYLLAMTPLTGHEIEVELAGAVPWPTPK